MPARRLQGGSTQVLLLRGAPNGVNLRVSPTLIPGNQARTLRNFSLREPGTLVASYGYKSFTTSSLGTGRAQGGQRIYLKGGVQFTLVAFGGSLYQPSDAGVWGSPVLTGLHATNQVHFVHDRDLVAVLDGSSIPQKSTDGTTWTQLGIDAPTSAPALSLVAGGSLLDGNTYEVSYAYRDDELLHRGNDGPTATLTVNAAIGQTIRVTGARSTDPQVDTVEIYVRNTTTGESVRRRVGTVANPASGTWTFDIDGPDTDWEQGIEAPIGHEVAPPLSFGVVWKNRWWARDASTGNRIRLTEVFEPQAWNALFFIDLPLPRGESITALAVNGDTLVVFSENSLYLIIGQTSLDFEVRPASGVQAGALGPRAVAVVESGVLHAATSGLYVFDGATDKLLSYDLDPAWRDLAAHATATDLAAVAVIHHAATKEVRVAVPRLYPLDTPGEWILDLNRTQEVERPVWTASTRAIGGYLYWNGPEPTTGNRERLFSWSVTEGKLFEETGTDADGADLVAEYESTTLSLGLLVARFIELFGEYRPTPGSLAVEVRVDGVALTLPAPSIGGSLTAWGTKKWGTFLWGGRSRTMFTRMLPLAAQGRTASVRVKYTGKDAFQLFTLGLSVVPEPLPRGL